MKRFVLPIWIFYPLAAVFLVAALGSVWITWQAQKENYALGLAINQIYHVVARAGEMRLSPNADPLKAQSELISILVQQDKQQSTPVLQESDGRVPVLALVNPWGEKLKISLQPIAQTVRLETTVSSNNCRRILNYYAKDVDSLGLQRVDVVGNVAYGLWELVYDAKREQEGSGGIDLDKIKKSCGTGARTAVSLIFLLPQK